MCSKEQRQTVWVVLLLMLGVAVLYWRTGHFYYIDFDDGLYVVDNPHVKNGFSWDGLRWCFQAGYASNWHPLTWMSLMLDCQLFGMRAGPTHLINAFLHAINSALLFLVLKRMTGAFWRSAMVAALFAWHPLRVESVAWISERKDVLSALFWMLALWTYVRHAENPGRKIFYALTILFYALGLMAKPMVITLPVVLLFLDWWPLRRITRENIRARLWEKAPFIVLALGGAVMTIAAQNNAIADLQWHFRLENAAVSCIAYIGKIFWPVKLSLLYPQYQLPIGLVIACTAALVCVSAIVLLSWRAKPYWLAGWGWYLVTLLPVIGIVQVGPQSMADRYTYIPGIGILIVVCWTVEEVTRQWRLRNALLAPAAALALVACAFLTHAQVGYWANSETLFLHALKIDPNNYLAHAHYGRYLRDQNQLRRAQFQFEQAITVMPGFSFGYEDLSSILVAEGKTVEAIKPLQSLLALDPNRPDVRSTLATMLFQQGRISAAENELADGVRLNPADAGLRFLLGRALRMQGRYPDADKEFAVGTRLAPDDPAGHYQWALSLASENKTADAIAQYRATLQLSPDLTNALNNLAWLLCTSPDSHTRDGHEALRLATRACALTQTNNPVFLETLANACAECGRFNDAISWADKSAKLAQSQGQPSLATQSLELAKLYRARHVYYNYP